MQVKRQRLAAMTACPAMAKRFFFKVIFFGLLFSVLMHGATIFENKKDLHRATKSRVQKKPNGAMSETASSSMSLIKEDYSIKMRGGWNGNFSCSSKRESDPPTLSLKNFFRDETEWKENESNIFLTETSCNSKPKYRAWCSVESMAKQNPEATVWYVLTSPEVDTQDGFVHSLLQKHKNLRIVTIDLEDVFKGTPLQELYLSGAWYKDTEWPAANLSDMMRLALVWKVGGFYSDTDIVCISSLAGLRNVIGLEAFNLVNGAFFHFNRHHKMLLLFMSYLNQNFNPNDWGKNGPQTVSSVLRMACKGEILSPSLKCENLTILSTRAFHPVQHTQRNVLFRKSKETDLKKRFPYSYTIHFWNRDTNKSPIIKDSGTIIDLASAAFCPMSREQATKNSHIY